MTSLIGCLRELRENLERLFESLKIEAEKGTPIIVEGKNDIQSLGKLGVRGRMISAKSGRRTRLEVVSEIERTEAKEVILLLDFDRRGVEWVKYLRRHLERTGMKINVDYWTGIFKYAGKEVKDIEGLPKYIDTLNRKIGVED